MSIFLHQPTGSHITSTWHTCPSCDVCNVQVSCGNQAHFWDPITGRPWWRRWWRLCFTSCFLSSLVSPPQETHVLFLVGTMWESKDYRLGNNTHRYDIFLFSVEGKPLVVTRQCALFTHRHWISGWKPQHKQCSRNNAISSLVCFPWMCVAIT